MRHQKAGSHLSRTSAHRQALFSNLVAALFTHGRIRTTDAKAKATRRLAERTITWARRLGDVLTMKPERRSPEQSARVVHAVRMARRVVRNRDAVLKLFDEIGPRLMARRGGYTRIVKIGQRPGDAAPMSFLELMPDGVETAEKAEAPSETKGKGSGAAKTKSGSVGAKKVALEASKAKPKAKAADADSGAAPAKPKAKAKAKKQDE